MAKRQRQPTKRERKATATTTAFGRQLGELVRARDARIRHEPHSGEGPKMSETLLEWAAPLLHPIERRELGLYRNMLSFAALLWNEATESEAPSDAVADKVIGVYGPEAPAALASIRADMIDMVAARRAVYGHDRRLIFQVEAKDSANRRHVNVAATLLTPVR